MYRYTLLLVILLAACISKKKNQQPVRAMYFWRTAFNPTKDEISFLENHKINCLYVKYMDIGWDAGTKEAIPKTVSRFQPFKSSHSIFKKIAQSRDWIPVIYITNEALQQTDSNGVKKLAGNISTLMNKVWGHQCAGSDIGTYKEIQFDCDWSVSTRDKYFYFLDCYRKEANDKVLSATIRLHQYKYPEKTGVPPVEMGMLMFYNMGDIRDVNTTNSIYDTKTAMAYVTKGDYPLPLDIALPAFSWTAIYRNNKLIHLLENEPMDMRRDTAHFTKIKHNTYLAITDTTIENVYYRLGDVFKFEELSPALLQDAASTAKQFVRNPQTVSIYSLNESQLKQYPYETVGKAFAVFD